MGLAKEGLDLGGVGAALIEPGGQVPAANASQRDGVDLIGLAVRMRG